MNLNTLAKKVDDAALTNTPISQISNDVSISLEDAYEIQKLSIARRLDRGEKLLGLKMGFTSKAKMEQMGVHDMILGRLTDAMLYEAGSELSRSKFIHPRAEPEIAFLIGKDIREEITLENVSEYVQSVALAVEVIDSRYEKFKFSLEDVVADNCSSAAFAIGQWHPVETNIKGILMSMVSDDVIVGKGNSDAILGNPLASMVAAARLANTYGEFINKGHVILAGAATPASYIKKGSTIAAFAEGLGSLFMDIV